MGFTKGIVSTVNKLFTSTNKSFFSLPNATTFRGQVIRAVQQKDYVLNEQNPINTQRTCVELGLSKKDIPVADCWYNENVSSIYVPKLDLNIKTLIKEQTRAELFNDIIFLYNKSNGDLSKLTDEEADELYKKQIKFMGEWADIESLQKVEFLRVIKPYCERYSLKYYFIPHKHQRQLSADVMLYNTERYETGKHIRVQLKNYISEFSSDVRFKAALNKLLSEYLGIIFISFHNRNSFNLAKKILEEDNGRVFGARIFINNSTETLGLTSLIDNTALVSTETLLEFQECKDFYQKSGKPGKATEYQLLGIHKQSDDLKIAVNRQERHFIYYLKQPEL